MHVCTCRSCGRTFQYKVAGKPFCSLKCSRQPGAKRSKGRDGSGSVSFYGYRYIRVGGRRVFEHRHVMSLMLGRPLTNKEVVHHKDGDKLNNSPSNLELLPNQSAHKSERHRKRFADETRKECSRCEQVKSRTDFNVRGKGGHNTDPHMSYCRECQAAYAASHAVKMTVGACRDCGREGMPLPSQGLCRACHARQWRAKNRERYNAYARKRKKERNG